MKIRSLIALASVTLVVGCAASSDDSNAEPGVGSADIVSMKSPEALAKWLGENHAVAFLDQFLDTRPNAVMPTFAWFNETSPLVLTPAKATEDAVAQVATIGRAADKANVAIQVVADDPSWTTDQATGAQCVPAGVWVHARTKDDVVTAITEESQSAAEKAKAASLAQEATVDVTIAVPGDEGTSQRALLTFGVVTRQLDPAKNSTPGLFWTLLGADVLPRCELPSDGD